MSGDISDCDRMGYYWNIMCEVRVAAKCPTMHRADKESLASPKWG